MNEPKRHDVPRDRLLVSLVYLALGATAAILGANLNSLGLVFFGGYVIGMGVTYR